jgi:hypothetical protein
MKATLNFFQLGTAFKTNDYLLDNEKFFTLEMKYFDKFERTDLNFLYSLDGFYDFYRKTHKSFQKYIVDILFEFIYNFYTSKKQKSELIIICPILYNETLMLCSLNMFFVKGKDFELRLKIITLPLKVYNNEPISVSIFENQQFNSSASKHIKELSLPRDVFTKKQFELFSFFVTSNLPLKQIALKMNKSEESIFKMAARIKENLSDYFQIEFSRPCEALRFYKDCFL